MALEFEFIFVLTIVYGTSYLLRFLERYDIPVLAAEILAGVIFGSLFGIITPDSAGYGFLTDIAAFGLLLIMFDAGLELDPALVKRYPETVGILGVLTFFFPFISGVALAASLGLGTFAAFLVGITISTTSLGLVYPLVEDFDLLNSERGQLILAVTVLNDILSVVALAYAITFSGEGGQPVLSAILVTVVLGVFLFVLPTVLAGRLSPYVSDRSLDSPAKIGVFVTVLFAWSMEKVGIHAILGGFFAGLFIAELTDGHEFERSMRPVLNAAAPVFFFFVGMQFDPSALWSSGPVVILAVLALGLGSKVIGAVIGGRLAGVDHVTTRLLASAMPGRLSISVAAAEIGFSRDIISATLYDAFIVLSVVSVFVASLLFRRYARAGCTLDTKLSMSLD